MSNFEKGLWDGYRIAKHNKFPQRSCEGNDTEEYKRGLQFGRRLYQEGWRWEN